MLCDVVLKFARKLLLEEVKQSSLAWISYGTKKYMKHRIVANVLIHLVWNYMNDAHDSASSLERLSASRQKKIRCGGVKTVACVDQVLTPGGCTYPVYR